MSYHEKGHFKKFRGKSSISFIPFRSREAVPLSPLVKGMVTECLTARKATGKIVEKNMMRLLKVLKFGGTTKLQPSSTLPIGAVELQSHS